MTHETPRLTADILPFIRSPSNSREALDVADWMRSCLSVYFLGCEIGMGICASSMRALAEQFAETIKQK